MNTVPCAFTDMRNVQGHTSSKWEELKFKSEFSVFMSSAAPPHSTGLLLPPHCEAASRGPIGAGVMECRLLSCSLLRLALVMRSERTPSRGQCGHIGMNALFIMCRRKKEEPPAIYTISKSFFFNAIKCTNNKKDIIPTSK